MRLLILALRTRRSDVSIFGCFPGMRKKRNKEEKEIRNNEIMVVDLALPLAQATEKLTEIIAVVGRQNVGIILTMPASTSANMIETTSNLTNNLAPIVALTKLDECDVSTAEFSSFATFDAKIGLLSASRSMADAPLFASESILMQYLTDNLNARNDCNNNDPTNV